MPCIPFSSLQYLIGGRYPHQIRDLRETVLIRNGCLHAERTVDLDGLGHPQNLDPTVRGHSLGWREGDVFVVDTVGFADSHSACVGGVPSGSAKHGVERSAARRTPTAARCGSGAW